MWTPFKKKQRPLLHCEVIHSLPGRVRIGCRALRYLKARAEEIHERLENHGAVTDGAVSVITGNVLLHYNQDLVTEGELMDMVESIVGTYSMIAYKEERLQETRQTVQERRLQEEPVSEMVTRVAVTATTLAFSMFRGSTVPVGASLFRRFLTVPALTALSLGLPIFRSGFHSLRTNMRPNADTLSSAAILASLIAGRDLSALTIIFLADIAELLTAWTMDRTRKAIRQMLATGEEYVWRVDDDGTEVKIRVEELLVGDRVLVNAGEKISVDGLVESGDGSVDEASITGEFLPSRKREGERVFAGTVMKTGRLVVRAEKVGDQTAVARILQLVEEAAHRKASVQAFADRFSANLIPLNFVLAMIVFAVTRSPSRALNMLIIDYSCGVRLSTATALSGAIFAAARHGILVKGSNYLELLDRADTLILDKTGTLTEGRAQVVSILPTSAGVESRELLETAAAAEETSTHPMAVAVLDKVKKSGWRIPEHSETKIHVAQGVETQVNGSVVRVGSLRFMRACDVEVDEAREDAARIARRGENIVYVARDKELLGVLGIHDMLRENMKKALNRLRYEGMDDLVLLTGDVEQHAEIVASRMAMDRYEAELLPEDKAETVLHLQSKGVHVVMVGDGVNDAPALAYADVGIAMGGTRTDIAMEASDVTITGDDPLMIPAIIQLAKKTMKIVRQNFAISVGVNTVGLILGSLGVLPVFWGAVLHNATTVAVVLNSGRLLLHDIEGGR